MFIWIIIENVGSAVSFVMSYYDEIRRNNLDDVYFIKKTGFLMTFAKAAATVIGRATCHSNRAIRPLPDSWPECLSQWSQFQLIFAFHILTE